MLCSLPYPTVQAVSCNTLRIRAPTENILRHRLVLSNKHKIRGDQVCRTSEEDISEWILCHRFEDVGQWSDDEQLDLLLKNENYHSFDFGDDWATVTSAD